jgi:methyl-accepting chemotaxis protein
MPKMEHLDQMFLNYRKIRINLTVLGLEGLPKDQAEQSVNNVLSGMQDYEKANKIYNDLEFIPGQKEHYDKLQSSWLEFKGMSEELLQFYKSGTPADHAKLMTALFEEAPKKAEIYTIAVNSLAEFHRKAADNKVQSAISIRDSSNILILVIVIGGTLFGAIFGFLFSTALAKTLNRISDDIFGAAAQTAAGGTQLASASAQLSTGATEAAASLEETVASIEELSSMVKLNTSNAQEANNLSRTSRESAEKGAHEIEQLITAMTAIADGSKKIEEIIHVIDDIAFQTNLLALNAAVEAARAGEQGKGFAVVAEAVRALAQKSAESAKGINSLIKENVEKSERGAVIAGNSGAVLKQILTSVKKVADLNGEISAGSNEQSTGLEQISKAMNQLDQATQGNAASSEEVAASSEEMSAQANTLSSLVGELRVLVHGAQKGGTTTERRHTFNHVQEAV